VPCKKHASGGIRLRVRRLRGGSGSESTLRAVCAIDFVGRGAGGIGSDAA
jgi:hypothetical protein